LPSAPHKIVRIFKPADLPHYRTGADTGVLNAQTGLAQRVATAPNATYMASAWLRVDGGGFLTFALKDRLPEAKTIVQGGDYKQVSFTFTTGAQETFVTLYFWMASAGKTAAVDDVTVSLKNDPQK